MTIEKARQLRDLLSLVLAQAKVKNLKLNIEVKEEYLNGKWEPVLRVTILS